MLERAKIAAEMKDLDQPSRASLRKYGVRFGAYHIYFPALLKPAARALASLLWAQKQDNVDMSALSGAQHLAGAGRTSFPVDKTLPRDAYRVLGYRQCGERAVRVDILERLADLIRPALAWRETSPGDKARRRVRRPRLCGDAGDDVADGIGRRGFCLGAARARLSHGAPPAAAAEAGGGGGAAVGDGCRRGRASRRRETPMRRRQVPDIAASSATVAGVRRSAFVGRRCPRATPAAVADRARRPPPSNRSRSRRRSRRNRSR